VIVNPVDIFLGDCDGVVVLKPEAAESIIRNVEEHNKGEQDPAMRAKPYWERRGVIEKLKAMKNVAWE
jgi:regulator of RNase E activity RraA